MNITTAQAKLDRAHNAGLISDDEYAWYNRMIRRTEAYGNKLHWSQQNRMRANLLKDFA